MPITSSYIKSIKHDIIVSLTFIVCLFDGLKRLFQQYFSSIVAVSFIGGGPRGPGWLNELGSWIT
jgi:hypothetical protein